MKHPQMSTFEEIKPEDMLDTVAPSPISDSEEHSVSLYYLSGKDKQAVRSWIRKQREYNTPAWTKTQEERDGYEKALRHLMYALDDEGLTL